MKTKYYIVMIILFLCGANMAQDKNLIAKNAESVCPIKIGANIPDAIIRTLEGKEVNIKDITNGQKSIIVFYRGGWCPYCNMQLSSLQKIEEKILEMGYKIIAISMDNPKHLKSTLDKYEMKYELYSDSKANASKAFGIAFKAEDDYVSKLKEHNLDIENASGELHHILPVPSVFIIDKNGIIKFEYVNPDYKIRISEKLLLEAAK